MVLRQYIDSFTQPTAADTILDAAYTAGDPTLVVAAVPADVAIKGVPFYIRIANTIYDVTAVGGAGNRTWTVTRDIRTVLASHSLGASVFLDHTAADHEALVQKALLTAKGSLFVATASGVVTEIAVGADGTVLRANSGQPTGLEWAVGGGGGSVTLIERKTPTGVGTTTFSAIPGGYKNLKLIMNVAGTSTAASQEVRVQFNGDAGANYIWVLGVNSGLAYVGQEGLPATYLKLGAVEDADLTNYANTIEMLIANYSGTSFYKSYTGAGAHLEAESNGNFFILMPAGFWKNTNAITDITVFLGAGNFATGSHIDLYGLS